MCDVTCFFYEYSHETLNQLWLRPFIIYVHVAAMCWCRSHLAYGTCIRHDCVSVEQRKRCDVVRVASAADDLSFNSIQSMVLSRCSLCRDMRARSRIHRQRIFPPADDTNSHFVTYQSRRCGHLKNSTWIKIIFIEFVVVCLSICVCLHASTATHSATWFTPILPIWHKFTPREKKRKHFERIIATTWKWIDCEIRCRSIKLGKKRRNSVGEVKNANSFVWHTMTTTANAAALLLSFSEVSDRLQCTAHTNGAIPISHIIFYLSALLCVVRFDTVCTTEMPGTHDEIRKQKKTKLICNRLKRRAERERAKRKTRKEEAFCIRC